MKIWIGTRYIDTSYFRTWCLNEDLHMVYFIHQPKEGYNGEFSLPLLFSSLEEAKRFYEESWNAIADGSEAIWCLDKQTSFCWALYFKLHMQQLKLKKNKRTKGRGFSLRTYHPDLSARNKLSLLRVSVHNYPSASRTVPLIEEGRAKRREFQTKCGETHKAEHTNYALRL